jgi:thiol-disulfide isomerase/thioredoxin
VFSSCSPTYEFILASILPANFSQGFIYLLSYTAGLVIFLLLLSIFGRKLISKFGWAADPHGWFRRILGALFIILGIAIISGAEIRFETWLASHTPFDITKVEQKAFDQAINPGATVLTPNTSADSDIFNVAPTKAPELTGLGAWINSDPTTLEQLRGKVVLVDFWTYSCINCIRTLPYIEKWYETYKDKGFVVLGIHAPEFSFEHVEANVRAAASEHGLTYPIALDNDFATWRAYDNHYWPAHYLIDKDGNIRYTHFGEGEYATTEKAIQILLGEEKPLVTQDPTVSSNAEVTPETYFGIDRAKGFVGTPRLSVGDTTFTAQNSLALNTWALSGDWNIASESITSRSDEAKLTFHVYAKNVYVVASSESGEKSIGIKVDGETGGAWKGKDVVDGKVVIAGSELYNIISFDDPKEATIELTVPKGVSLFTFTFGG